MPTYCENCQHVRLDRRSDPPWRWYCIKHPRMNGWGFVMSGHLNMAPYLRCYDVNGGACPVYEEGDNPLPKQTQEEIEQ